MMMQYSSSESETTTTHAESSSSTPLRITALQANHLARGAKMVPFAGWNMPLQYGRIMEEHHAVRQTVGLFDISHMGLIRIHSADRSMSHAFLERMVPRSLAKLYPGKAVYTQLLNENGGIIDDIIIYEMPESEHLSEFQEFLIIANAANTEADTAWLRKQAQELNFKGLRIESINSPPSEGCALTRSGSQEQPNKTTPSGDAVHPSEGGEFKGLVTRYSFFALQGPLFEDVLARTGYETDMLPERFHIQEAQIQGTPVWISSTGYTGEDGVEIIVPSAQANALWDLLLEVGRPNGIKPIGLAARDTLRLEAAYPLHGHDISENDSPLEAGLDWSVRLNRSTPLKSGDFIGKTALEAQLKNGLTRHFYCFTVNHRSIARQGDRILKNGNDVGVVTSGSISPLFNEPIGMGYIQTDAVVGPGDSIEILVRGKVIHAQLVERPFYQPSELPKEL